MPSSWSAIVLAGGRGRRMGGANKPQLQVGGVRLLDVALAAVVGATPVVVVGGTDVPSGALSVVEQPRYGGPVAALAAGLAVVSTEIVVVLAADLPFVTPEAVHALREAVIADGAVAVDDTGRWQSLLAAYRTCALRAALPEIVDGARLRDVLDRLALVPVPLTGSPPPWQDCDTAEDLDRAREGRS